MQYLRNFLLGLGLWLMITGCTPVNKNIIVLMTNRAEFVAYGELFNSLQKQYKLEIKYEADPVQFISSKESIYPDLIISEGLASREYINKFDAVNDLVSGRINAALFYKDLLANGMYGNTQKLIPINFNLPALFFKPENMQKPLPRLLITFE
jgi:hypothetical protein